ncbi:MAG: heme exporter protein CcmD [Halomonas sp.]|nr:heme exporter protein CcmD [Halomonas sp.]TVP49905.1 MAG: heme exporter protein CcmD [Halomonas sp.]
MAFDSISQFLAMGGHAPYVWSAWGITALLLVTIVWHARAEHRQLLNGVKRRVRRERARSAGASQVPPNAARFNSVKGGMRDDA